MLKNVLGSLLLYPLHAWRARLARKLHAAAMARKDAGDIEGAERDLEQVVAMDPRHVEARHWLGLFCARRQDYDGSVRHFQQALAAGPSNAEIWTDLGNVHALQQEYGPAAASYRAAIEADPDAALAHLNLGVVLKEQGRLEEAVASMHRAWQLAPAMENALRNLVVALVAADRCEEALAIADEAVAREPGYDALFCQGLARQKLHEPVQAIASYEAASRLRADDAELYDNRGTALVEIGRLDEAMASYERALALKPGYDLAAFHRALARLLTGNFREGWEGYELRRLDRDYPAQPDIYPRWEGEPLAGRTLLVAREQGLGDEIMFASCLPQLMGMAGRCVVECEPRLLPIFRRSFPGATVYASPPGGGVPPEVAGLKPDFFTSAGSVPRFMRRDIAEFPRHSGYLKADPARIEHWRGRLSALGPGMKIGVSWRGGVRKTRRALRSVSLEQWLPILRAPGARFVSLQYTADAAEEAAALRGRHGVEIEHWSEAIADYDETAALVCALDLVVSVCTAVIHLGGALGRPVWVMAPYSPEWRYGFSGDTMPWYPSVRVFRQPAFGAWEPVIASVASGLETRAGGRGPLTRP